MIDFNHDLGMIKLCKRFYWIDINSRDYYIFIIFSNKWYILVYDIIYDCFLLELESSAGHIIFWKISFRSLLPRRFFPWYYWTSRNQFTYFYISKKPSCRFESFCIKETVLFQDQSFKRSFRFFFPSKCFLYIQRNTQVDCNVLKVYYCNNFLLWFILGKKKEKTISNVKKLRLNTLGCLSGEYKLMWLSRNMKHIFLFSDIQLIY